MGFGDGGRKAGGVMKGGHISFNQEADPGPKKRRGYA